MFEILIMLVICVILVAGTIQMKNIIEKKDSKDRPKPNKQPDNEPGDKPGNHKQTTERTSERIRYKGDGNPRYGRVREKKSQKRFRTVEELLDDTDWQRL